MSYELTAKRIEMSVEDAKKLRDLMPVKFMQKDGELLFGIRIVPNRTLKNGQFIVDYGEGACQLVEKTATAGLEEGEQEQSSDDTADDSFDYEAVSECVRTEEVHRASSEVASEELCSWLPHWAFSNTLFVWPAIPETGVQPLLRESRAVRSMRDANIPIYPAPTLNELCAAFAKADAWFRLTPGVETTWAAEWPGRGKKAVAHTATDAVMKLWFALFTGHGALLSKEWLENA